MISEKELAKELIEFIDDSYSMFHAVEVSRKILLEEGFEELDLGDSWSLEEGGRYFTCKNGSAIVAFTIGGGSLAEEGFRMIGSHTDSPGFRIKPNPELLTGNYLKLNTEVYGGPILNTWLDRPLSLAGRVSTMTEDALRPRDYLLNIDRPILIIPNLAIHMNRTVNDGFKLNTQDHTLPIISLVEEKFEKDDYLLRLIGEELGIDYKNILDFELYLYAREKGELLGLNEEFISVGKLDNLAMLQASLKALINAGPSSAVNMLVAFDNEEVGSSTKQGAGSPFLRDIMERISMDLGYNGEDFYRAMENSFLISSDMAHAVHPNFADKADPSNRPLINKGPAIKIAANQAYTTDSRSAAVYEAICRRAQLPVQKFVNRSDLRGGSTIGPISSSQLAISSVDIGNPILAMHSVRELGGVKDHHYVYRSFLEFFQL